VTEPKADVTVAAVTSTARPGVQLCRDATVDAATAFNLTTYFFKGLLQCNFCKLAQNSLIIEQ